MVDEERLVIRIVLRYGHDHMFLVGEDIPVGLTHHRIDIRVRKRRSHDDVLRFSVKAAEVGRKNTVYLPACQRFQSGRRSGKCPGLKVEEGVLDASGGGRQIILQCACQFTRRRVCGAKGEMVVLIPHPDDVMGGKP